MWKTTKSIKKAILITLENIKQKVITLSDLTLGLKWKSVVFIIGNARLLTSNGEHKITLNSKTINNDSIDVDIYNTTYKTNISSMLLMDTNHKLNPEIKKTGFLVPTQSHTVHMYGSFEFTTTELTDSISVSFSIIIYAVDENDEIIQHLHTESITPSSWLITSSFSSDEISGEESHGSQTFSIIVNLPPYIKYRKLRVYADRFGITSVHWGLRVGNLYLNVSYVDFTQELERTSTDIHLIAWEES